MNKSTKMILVFVLLCCSINTQISRVILNQHSQTDKVNQNNQVSPWPPSKPCFNYTICGNYCWSQWYDRDDPNGVGDYEIIRDLKNEYKLSCPDTQVLVECQTTTGIPFYQTGDTVNFNQVDGCWCVNAENSAKGGCKYDYRLRILCPC